MQIIVKTYIFLFQRICRKLSDILERVMEENKENILKIFAVLLSAEKFKVFESISIKRNDRKTGDISVFKTSEGFILILIS